MATGLDIWTLQKYIGHLDRQELNRLTFRIVYRKPSGRLRRVDRPQKRFDDIRIIAGPKLYRVAQYQSKLKHIVRPTFSSKRLTAINEFVRQNI